MVAEIRQASPPGSYRFTYSPISPLFMACMSGVEDVVGVVDAQARVVLLTTLQRPGDMYSLDGELLIHRELLGLDDDHRGQYARVSLDATTDVATRARIENALGTALSALIAGGAWPNHPTDTVLALIPLASTITTIDPDRPSQRAIRIVLDTDAYTDETGTTAGRDEDAAPIVDINVAEDGTIARLVARLPDATDPAIVQDHSAGYAVAYDYDTQIRITAPDNERIFNITADELPTEPTATPCQLEP